MGDISTPSQENRIGLKHLRSIVIALEDSELHSLNLSLANHVQIGDALPINVSLGGPN